ncbi:MAG: Dam family site-specific DNA-(adenine-N6)-methyltransferase [Caldilineae bacterium]|nr:MAG: Dam family site-specific DNA-(adenine-N6)-methyltransferase [Caldilineae bacterium]
MSSVQVPPIKCQGIKTKLVPFIRAHIQWSNEGKWIEPFLGSGVVGFNINPKRALFADANPHIIHFYQGINEGQITPAVVKRYLVGEGEKLSRRGADYYYEVRERFNQYHEPLDFLFLNRAGFNGMIRFNTQGELNVPFNHKPERFSKSYITKIVNQVRAVYQRCRLNDWQFICQDFRETIAVARQKDFIYCDPPYAGRHVDYFDRWGDEEETALFEQLSKTPARFMLSTWHSNQHRHNPYLDRFWSRFFIASKEHFYHVGAKEVNRKPMLEAIVMNYQPEVSAPPPLYYQPGLLDKKVIYPIETEV